MPNLSCEALIKSINAYIEKTDEDMTEKLEEAGFIDADKIVETASKLEERIANTLIKETQDIVKQIEEVPDIVTLLNLKWDEIKSSDNTAILLESIFKEEFTAYILETVPRIVEKNDSELVVNTISKRTKAWIESWSEELGQNMNLNSHKEIENILVNGLQEGHGIPKIIQAILDNKIHTESEEKWEKNPNKARLSEYYRARRTAITETLTAHSVAAQEAYSQSPAVEKKEWRHTGSRKNKPRKYHEANASKDGINGQIVEKNDKYTLKGIKGETLDPMYPRDTSLPPEERINCHCISQPVVSEEILGLPLEERRRLQQEAIDEMDDEWEKELDAKNKAKAGIEE